MKKILFNRILLGVTGGIAAYKSATLARLLCKAGCAVEVVLTESAQSFITPLTFQALTGRPTHTELLDPAEEAGMGHIQLARFAQAILIAPASANCIAKLAHGLADDLLSTLCLASNAQIIIVPAMNQQMWAAPATKANIATLIARGVRVLGPDSGIQACGDTGPGRMLEPETIIAAISSTHSQPLKVMLTAGPTREAIDPVRYLTNHSSGKMGYAIAAHFHQMGHSVTLVTGPTQLSPPCPRVRQATSAQDMATAVMQDVAEVDLFISTAAVADFRPKTASAHKIKKSDDLTLNLIKNPDILTMVSTQFPNVFTVGFAAETDKLLDHAQKKLKLKALDMICANLVGQTDTGFDSDDNALSVISADAIVELPRQSKTALAKALYSIILERYYAKNSLENS